MDEKNEKKVEKTEKQIEEDRVKDMAVLKKSFPDVVDQTINRSYLSLGYVTHTGSCAGVEIILRTLRRGERTFLNRVAPINFYSDKRTLNKIISYVSGSSPQTVKVGDLLDEIKRQSGVQDLFETLMLLFSIDSFSGESLSRTLGDINTLEDLYADEAFMEKLSTIKNYPAEVVDLMLVMITEVNLAFQFAMEDVIRNPS